LDLKLKIRREMAQWPQIEMSEDRKAHHNDSIPLLSVSVSELSDVDYCSEQMR